MWLTRGSLTKLALEQILSNQFQESGKCLEPPTNKIIKVISRAAQRNKCYRPTFESSFLFMKILFHLKTFLCCLKGNQQLVLRPENCVTLPLARRHILWYFILHHIKCEMRPCLAVCHREGSFYNFCNLFSQHPRTLQSASEHSAGIQGLPVC